ncbi:nuclear transport factor 2 family protein [Sinomicrobium kalidii]|uniref:nuclear transport factor 2 family protein n=1 Tax=Sinomicrobium kalidii TaxID=2900738 RepID=UPI001E45DE58|nr:nuclear transport factor 2 family protein [Sinomicrobium kalidii]UGU14890.1 nuclear transport factor 2 family protein [Sinomicrobium kalidii]
MTKITVKTDCGNAPKREFLKEFNIAFAKENIGFLTESVTDDIVWNIVGDKKIAGKKNFTDELEKMKTEKAAELILDQILSHGKEGAANGVMKMQNGKKYAFSDFYEFNSAKGAKLKSITSYVIEIQ